VIEAHGAGLFTIDHPLHVLGVSFGTRSVIVLDDDGRLLLISPGPLTDDDLRSIRELGNVEALIAPNLFHHLFLADATKSFPEAEIFMAPGLQAKCRDLPPGVELSDERIGSWKHTLDHFVFQPSRHIGEVVFHHAASRTLILTDLVFNLGKAGDPWTYVVRRLLGVHQRFGPSRIMRRLLRLDRDALEASIQRILSWDFDRIVMSHGEIVHSDGRARLAEALRML